MPPNAIKRLTGEDKIANHPYRVGALFTLQKAAQDIPKPFYPPSWVVNQALIEAGNDECGGIAAAFVSGLQERKQLDPHFHWMMARERSNMGLNDYGVSNRDLAMTLVKVGSLLKEESPLDFKNGRDKIATPASWNIPEMMKKAIYQKKGSVVWVTAGQGMDAFDYFKASVLALNKKYSKPHGAVFGMMWNYSLSDYQLGGPSDVGNGHDVAVIATEGDNAVIVNSYGLEVGHNGEQLLPRETFNRWAEEFGCFIPIDATQEEIKWAVENGVKLDGNWLLNILVSLANTLKDLFAQLKQKTMGIFTKKVGSTMLWDTPSHIRFNVRTICDELYSYYKVPYWKRWFMKAEICACIKQESNWSSKDGKTVVPIIGKPNSNGTRDWGLCQYNDGKYKGKPLWIGEGALFKDTDEALSNMEKGVREMVKQQIAGNLWYWSSYKFGDYKKHLTSESRPSTPY